MSWRFCTLVRRDHDDLDHALVAMVASATPIDELGELLEVLRLALVVHVEAETKALSVLASPAMPPAVRLVVAQAREEHRAQRAAIDALADVEPGSEAWYARVLDLRIQALDHASRAELLRWTIDDHVVASERGVLASRYAKERMCVLGRTSPVAFAPELSAAAQPRA